jgi:ketosteroid isomerase-like protein
VPRNRPPPATADDTEAEFYEALQAGDIERLMAVWSDDDDIVCVHPGGPRVVGPAAIRASFEGIFASGGIPVRPEQGRRLVGAGVAVHSVLERIDVIAESGPRTAWVVATNVYLKTAQGWRIAAHHASPGAPGAEQEVVEAASVLH